MTAQRTETSAALGFTSLNSEITTPRELPVRGELPGWLTGSLLRTGPALWDINGHQLRHWFDGLAMLHNFTFGGGQARYVNRFLHSPAYTAAKRTGEISFREFATDPCRSIFQRVQSLFTTDSGTGDNANVNIARLGDRFLAMTESALPVVFDRDTLETAGVGYRAPGQVTTAHPHFERPTGALLNYAAKLGARSSYRFFRVDPADASTTVIAEVPVRTPAYMHSFGMTENYFVLTEFPLVVTPASLAMSGKPFIENYRWEPERGTTFTLINRRDGKVHRKVSTEAFFAFHHVNAYEEDTDVVVDICTTPDSSIIDDLYLDRIHDRLGTTVGRVFAKDTHLTRYRVDTAGNTISSETLSEHPVELPVINHRDYAQRAHRFVWGVSYGSGWIDRLIKVDTRTGETRLWAEENCYPGEPIFVPRPSAEAEDDGVLLSVVLDAGKQTSSLVVLDAATLQEVARADVPHHIPFSFHGSFTRH